MTTVRFEGFSDGCFVAKSEEIDEEVLCRLRHGVFLVKLDGKEFAVTGAFSPMGANNGCWTIGIQLADCGSVLPKFSCRYEYDNKNEASPVFCIETDKKIEVIPIGSD